MTNRPPRALPLALLACLLSASARGDLPAGAQMLELRSGSVQYTLVHKLHEVKGKSEKLEGRALVLAGGAARVQVRVAVASFDSGNSNRDAHMREATHELQHPHVTIKGTLDGITLPLASAVDKTMQATVELNGERGTVAIPVKLAPEDGKVRATFAFPISLEAFKVERPELLFVKVDDAVKIEGDVLFEAAK
jgi:hypothetical protein